MRDETECVKGVKGKGVKGKGVKGKGVKGKGHSPARRSLSQP